jgi:hypothetical protein
MDNSPILDTIENQTLRTILSNINELKCVVPNSIFNEKNMFVIYFRKPLSNFNTDFKKCFEQKLSEIEKCFEKKLPETEINSCTCLMNIKFVLTNNTLCIYIYNVL